VLEAVLEAVVAAFLFAVGSALQHRASEVARLTGMAPARLASFVRSVAGNRVWALALAFEAAGACFHAVALHEGALVLVQPLLVTSLVFALVVRRQLDRATVAASDVRWAVLLAGGLAMFLLAATPANAAAQPADTVPAIAISAGSAVLVVAVVALSWLVGGAARPFLLGLGAGVVFAGTAALVKTAGDALVARGPVDLLGNWVLWATIVAGAVGIVLNQLAFQSGPLAASLPVIQTVGPVMSLVLGVVVYDEQLRSGALAVSVELVGLVVTLVAAAVLSRGRERSVAGTALAAPGLFAKDTGGS
jgi:hypothetical protein